MHAHFVGLVLWQVERTLIFGTQKTSVKFWLKACETTNEKAKYFLGQNNPDNTKV